MKIKPIDDNNSEFNNVYLFALNKSTNKTPHCLLHGAMNKVSVFEYGSGYWRCLQGQCRSGCIERKFSLIEYLRLLIGKKSKWQQQN